MNAFAAQAWTIIRNDVRLFWRELMGGGQLSALRRYGTVLILFGLMQAPILVGFFVMKKPPAPGVETLAWLLILVVMTGAAMARAIVMLYERTDFDLLLSSPVAFHAVLFARLVSITLIALLSVSIFVLPILNGAVLGLSVRYLGAFAVWALLAAIGGAAGTAATLGLVRALGNKRAQVAAQITAGLLSSGLMLVFLLPALMGKRNFEALKPAFNRLMELPVFAAVGRADRGAPLELAGLALVAFAALAFTSRLMARMFVAGVQESATSAAPRRRAPPHRWRAGLNRAAFRKELRLIVRSPKLVGSAIAMGLLLGVVAAVGFRFGGLPVLAPVALFIGSQLAFLFAAIAAEAETCWGLSRLSPNSVARLRGVKMAASMAGPLTLTTALCVWLALAGRPWLALITLVCSVACAAGSAWIGLATVKPAPRQDVLQTSKLSKVDPRQLTILALFYPGVGGLGLAAFGHYAWAIVLLGTMLLCVLGSFTLIEPRESEETNP